MIPIGNGLGSAAQAFAGGILSGVAQAKQQAHAEVLAERIRQQQMDYQRQVEADRQRFQVEREMYRDFVGGQRDERNFEQQRQLQTNAQAFQEKQAGTKRAQELEDAATAESRDVAQGQELLRAAGVGQPGEDFYLNPNAEPVVPKVGKAAAGALLTDRRMRQMGAADDARADERLALDRQRLEQAAQKLAAAAQRKDLTPEQSREVQAAIQVINDRSATPAEYAAAFMVARKYDYAPVGAAIQKREDPKDSAEAKVLQGKIQRASAEMLSLVRKTGKTTADRTRIQQLDAEITAMETQFQSKYGSGGGQASPADLTDDELDRELTGR